MWEKKTCAGSKKKKSHYNIYTTDSDDKCT